MKQEHRLSDVAIVEKIYLLNYIFAVTMAATVIEAVLFYENGNVKKYYAFL